MAVLKIESPKNRYKDESVYHDEINYILKKTSKAKKLYFANEVSLLNAACEMQELAKLYRKDFGTRIRHTILAFAPNEEIDADRVKLIGKEVFSFYEDQYQYIGAVHTDTDHLYIHTIMSTVNIQTGKKYGGTRKEWMDF